MAMFGSLYGYKLLFGPLYALTEAVHFPLNEIKYQQLDQVMVINRDHYMVKLTLSRVSGTS
jgi:predicted HAD superfamily hydrolase